MSSDTEFLDLFDNNPIVHYLPKFLELQLPGKKSSISEKRSMFVPYSTILFTAYMNINHVWAIFYIQPK